MNDNSNAADDDALLLQALVSPVAEQRRAAEAAWKALRVEDRLGRLLRASSGSNNSNSNNQQLAPILLRRELLQLDNATLLQQVLVEILKIKAAEQHNNHYYDYCLAEIAGALEWMDEAASVQAVTTMLSQYPNEVR